MINPGKQTEKNMPPALYYKTIVHYLCSLKDSNVFEKINILTDKYNFNYSKHYDAANSSSANVVDELIQILNINKYHHYNHKKDLILKVIDHTLIKHKLPFMAVWVHLQRK